MLTLEQPAIVVLLLLEHTAVIPALPLPVLLPVLIAALCLLRAVWVATLGIHRAGCPAGSVGGPQAGRTRRILVAAVELSLGVAGLGLEWLALIAAAGDAFGCSEW